MTEAFFTRQYFKMSYELITTLLVGGVAHIKLNRPEKLNALNGTLINELFTAAEDFSTYPDCRIIVLSGTGRAFSAGVDLKESAVADFASDSGVLDTGLRLSLLLERIPQVTIAQIHGYCFTGALEIALMFDLIYCDDDTVFGDTHAKWSIMPRWGMTQRLARRIGLHRAKEMTFRAALVKGPEADRIGLVNKSFNAGQLEIGISQVVEDIVKNDAGAIRAIKQLYNDGFATTLSEGLEIELATDPFLPNTGKNIDNFDQKKRK